MADRTVSYVFKGNFSNLTAGLTVAAKSTQDYANKLTALDKQGSKMRAGLTQVGDTAGKLGLMAGAGLAGVAGLTAKFEKAMSAAGAATNTTGKELDALRKAAIGAGAGTIFSASEAADGITELGKAGVSTADILSGGLKGALDLAAAGQIGVAEAAETTASTLNQFGLAGDQATRVADVLSAAADAAQGGVTDMGQAMKFVGPLSSQMGVSLEETAGSIAELASQGILGSEAGTSLRGMLLSLTSPSKVAADEMKKLGIRVYDAQGKFVGFDGVAGQLHDSLGKLTSAQRDEALGRIFGNEQVTAARILYKGGADAVQQWTSKVNDSGHASERAAALTDNLSGDIEKLGGSLQTAAIAMGESSQGPLRGLVQQTTSAVDAFAELPGPVHDATVALLALTAVTGGGLWVGSKMVTGIAESRAALQALGVQASVTKIALRGAAGVGGMLALADASQRTSEGMGALEGAAGGALAGFSVGGPWGAAIGSGVGALYGLLEANNATNDSFSDSKDVFATYVESLDQVTGAVTEATKQTIRDNLMKDADAQGMTLDDVEKLYGVPTRDQIDAIAGDAEAMKRIQADLQEKVRKGLIDPAYAEDFLSFVRKQRGEIEENGKSIRDNTRDLGSWKEALHGLPHDAYVELKNLNFKPTFDEVLKLGQQYDLTPKQVRTIIRETGAAPTVAQMKALQQQYDLTPKQVRTLIKETGADYTIGQIDSVKGHLRDLDGGVATVRISTNYVSTGTPGLTPDIRRVPQGHAVGGYIVGPGTGTSDEVPAWLSNGEFVVNARATTEHRDLLEKMNAGHLHRSNLALASGGTVAVAGMATPTFQELCA